ncbi:MAG: hypothetical protein OXN25_04470 [Candidatus Poribacteria bacterium]|nr:hypothetical protein [Candidatus Poribacteria bacterium]
MKILLYICGFFTLIGGIAFCTYLIHDSTSKTVYFQRQDKENIQQEHTGPIRSRPQVPQEVTQKPTTLRKKACSCCGDALEKVKQKRKELEMWARGMIDTHGYEEGMKRVNAKSPTLAERVQSLLEKEKNARGIPTQMVR